MYTEDNTIDKGEYVKSLRLFVTVAVACCLCSFSCNKKTVATGSSQIKKLSNGGEVTGPRSVENIEQQIGMLVPRLQYFYQKELKENPSLEGTIELIFEVDANGSVMYVNMGKSTLKSPLFEEAILTALSNHTFGAWREGKDRTYVVYPMTFIPEKREETGGDTGGSESDFGDDNSGAEDDDIGVEDDEDDMDDILEE